MLSPDVLVGMNERHSRSRTTPLFRTGVTLLGLAGLLAVAAATGSLGALASVGAVATGLALAVAVTAFAWRCPDELVSTPRSEATALVVVWATGVLFGLYAPEALAVAVWVLASTLAGLVVLLVGRPASLARLLARVERSDLDR